MDRADLEALADLVADRVAARLAVSLDAATVREGSTADRRLVDAATLAGILGVTRAYVYEHADDLGAVRLGDGPRARLRFDPERARTAATGAVESPERVAPLPARCSPAPGSVLKCRPMRKLETVDGEA